MIGFRQNVTGARLAYNGLSNTAELVALVAAGLLGRAARSFLAGSVSAVTGLAGLAFRRRPQFSVGAYERPEIDRRAARR
jgi:hypothetical protein